MESLESSTRLIQEVLAVVVAEVLGSDDSVQIRLEKLLDEIDLVERVVRVGLNDVEDRNDLDHQHKSSRAVEQMAEEDLTHILADALFGKVLEELELS